jgi:hypothetical protein
MPAHYYIIYRKLPPLAAPTMIRKSKLSELVNVYGISWSTFHLNQINSDKSLRKPERVWLARL